MDYPGCFVCITPVYKGGLLCALALYLMIYQKSHCHIIFSVMKMCIRDRAGDVVKKGQTLAIVEAMKLMNEIECDQDGIITNIYVKNGENVEYGQPLFGIR